jgi:hypothetical protein
MTPLRVTHRETLPLSLDEVQLILSPAGLCVLVQTPPFQATGKRVDLWNVWADAALVAQLRALADRIEALLSVEIA